MGVVTEAAADVGGPFLRTPAGMLIPGPNRWTPSCACSPGTTTGRAEKPTPAPVAVSPGRYGVWGAPLGVLGAYWDG